MTNGIVDGHLNEDQQSMLADRPLSGIMSTTSSRPSTSATIVHVHSQPPVKIMPAVHRDPSFIQKSRSSAPLPNSNSVVFHENPTSYHTIIKVLTRLTPQFFQIILANTTNVIQGQASKIICLFFIQVQF